MVSSSINKTVTHSISICIPAYNEEKTIERTIDSIQKQLNCEIKEILICNNGSTDNTQKVIKEILKKSTIPITILKLPSPSKSAAWNILFAKAKHTNIVFCDADVILHPFCISKLLIENHHTIVGARCVPIYYDDSVLTKLVNYQIEQPYLVGRCYLVNKEKLKECFSKKKVKEMPEIIGDDIWLQRQVSNYRTVNHSKVYFRAIPFKEYGTYMKRHKQTRKESGSTLIQTLTTILRNIHHPRRITKFVTGRLLARSRILFQTNQKKRWERPETRNLGDKKQKVFVIGLSKTGTMSMTHWFRKTGYLAIHYKDTLDLLSIKNNKIICNPKVASVFDALSDTPVAHYFKEIYQEYPNAKFIYLTRNKEKWLESCQKHFTKGHYKVSNIIRKTFNVEVYGSKIFNRQKFSNTYDQHHTKVMTFFKDKQKQFISVDLSNKDAKNKIATFLQLKHTHQIPVRNKKTDINVIWGRLKQWLA
ncbi:MAG: glycosyltransferase involved in cell wall biosynthesis [Candidatus Woesearchaeota archaeon]